MEKIEEIIAQVDEFPTLPTIYSKLLDMLSDPHTTATSLAAFISNDPSATTKILKTVNSPIYGLQGKIDTMSQAISHIGFNEVKNLVLALSVIDLFSKLDSIENFSLVDFWKHSIAVGVISKLLGKRLEMKKIEPFYLAGILHDIGKIFFLRAFSDEYTQVVRTAIFEEKCLSEIENRRFGINHLEAGYLVARKWQLPETILKCIQFHNDGRVDGELDEQVACIHLADTIANILELGVSALFTVQRPDPEIWQFLKVEPGVIESLCPEILSAYNQAVSISFSS